MTYGVWFRGRIIRRTWRFRGTWVMRWVNTRSPVVWLLSRGKKVCMLALTMAVLKLIHEHTGLGLGGEGEGFVGLCGPGP